MAFRCGLTQFDGKVAHVRNTHGVLQLGLDARKGRKGGWVRLGGLLGVFVVVCDKPASCCRCIPIVVDECSIWIVGRCSGKVFKGSKVLFAGGDVVSDRATPELALLEGFDVEAGDDAEVIGATFE